jgi:amino acid transporter
VGLVSVGIAIALNQYYGPSLYPGAGVWLSTLLAAAGMLAVAVTFHFWSVIFPRSGGVYVSLSRGLSPAFAFVGSLVETVILLYYAAFAASLIVKVGLSSLGNHVYFTFNHEPETALNSSGNGADFIAAWRKVITVFRQRGSPTPTTSGS